MRVRWFYGKVFDVTVEAPDMGAVLTLLWERYEAELLALPAGAGLEMQIL